MKNSLLTGFLILFSLLASGQTWGELQKKAIEYHNKGEYASAEALYLEAKEKSRKETGEMHSDYATSLNNLAALYASMGQYQKAEPLFLRAIEIRKTVLGEADPDYASSLNRLAGVYYYMGQYEKAEPLYLEAKEIFKKAFGETHPDYAALLNSLAGVYQEMGQYQKAEPLYLQKKEIVKKVLGEAHPDYASSLSGLGVLYKDMGQYQKAEPLFLQAREIQKKVLGEAHPDYAATLNNLAGLYSSMGQYEKAEPLYLQAKEIVKSIYGETHPNYASTVGGLAGLYESMGQYEKAEPLYLQSKDIIKTTLGETSSGYLTSLNNLAVFYHRMGQYEKAELLYLKTKEIKKSISGETNLSYAYSLNNLGALYESMGQYEKAEQLFLQAKEIRKNILGETHPDYVITLNHLTWLYMRKGQYEKAEPLTLQTIEITKKTSGENPLYYVTSLNSAAVLYKILGQYTKAKALYITTREILKNVIGEKHPDYATSLYNLGELYITMGEYEKAEPLCIQANQIWKTTLGEAHPLYASSLNKLASLYKNMSQYEKAEKLYLQAKEIRKKVLGEAHPKYAESLSELGILYARMGQYKKAESLYIEASEIQKKTLGEAHPDYAASLNNMAGLYSNMGLYEKAEPLILSATRIEIQNLKNTFSVLSEKEKGDYLANNISRIEISNSLQFNYRKASPAVAVSNFDLQLFFKSLSLAATRTVLETIENSKDNSIQNVYKEWQSNKSLLAKQYSLPVKNRIQKLDSVEAKAEMLEKELTRKSSEFRNQQKAISISMQDVQKNLQQDEAAIEFVRFHLYNKKWTDSIIYAAYILRKNDAVPVFVPLFEEQQLQKLFDSAGKTTARMVKSFYSDIKKENKNTAFGARLYKLLWAPLEPYLNSIKQISYSPAGKLYSIAFHALSTDSSTLLMDKYNLQQYTSTRQIALRSGENQTVKPSGIVLFGGPRFSMDSLQLVKKLTGQSVTEMASTFVYTPQIRGSRGGVWDSLPGTVEEVKKISDLFNENKISTQSFIQTIASEENLKALSGNSPQILHIATHGFFLSGPGKKKKETISAQGNAYTLAEDPLLRSGLVFSGGNYAWSGKTPINGVEDGIATAYEISQLNLSNTELVVLSACETALGDVKGSEGVFGLQRAFKMAGVKKMIVSLWKVPDAETAELMTTFYTCWMKGKTINESFAQAQTDMQKKYSPFYWAAFVLVE